MCVCVCVCVFVFVCVCVWCTFMRYPFSSPYLLVFVDDRVCGTHEQMILQVEFMRLSRRVGKSLGVLYDFVLKYFVNSDERLYYYVPFL